MGTYKTIAHFGYHVNYFYIVVIFGREAQAKCVPRPLKGNHAVVLWRKSDCKGLPAQTVEATPSNQLIRQWFPTENPTVWLDSIRPSQGGVPFESTLATDF